MCFDWYVNYFPHNSHIINLFIVLQICRLTRMAVDVGHNRPIVLQICVLSLLRKHPKTSPTGILPSFSYNSIYCAEVFGKSTGLETYEFHRCIAEYLVCARIEFIFTGNGGKCAKIRLISWRCFLSQIFVKIFDASQVNTRRKREESREILIGWKWDENGAHTDLSATHSVLRWTVEIFQFLKNFDTVCLFGKFSAFSKWSKFPHFKIFSKKHLPVKIYLRVSFITPNILFSLKYVINGCIFSSTEVHFKGAVPP